MNEISEHTIDIDKILRDKMGRRARYVPGCLIAVSYTHLTLPTKA